MKQINKGFSLLEVLITILLVTIGILGMVAMQGRSIQYTQDSLQRTQAAILANELVEIVRASPTSVTQEDTDNLFFSDSLPTNTNAVDCLQIQANALMADQLGCWGDKVRRTLPGLDSADITSQFYVCLSSTPGDCGAGTALEVQLAWRASGADCLRADDSSGVPGEICTYRVRTQI